MNSIIDVGSLKLLLNYMDQVTSRLYFGYWSRTCMHIEKSLLLKLPD